MFYDYFGGGGEDSESSYAEHRHHQRGPYVVPPPWYRPPRRRAEDPYEDSHVSRHVDRSRRSDRHSVVPDREESCISSGSGDRAPLSFIPDDPPEGPEGRCRRFVQTTSVQLDTIREEPAVSGAIHHDEFAAEASEGRPPADSRVFRQSNVTHRDSVSHSGTTSATDDRSFNRALQLIFDKGGGEAKPPPAEAKTRALQATTDKPEQAAKFQLAQSWGVDTAWSDLDKSLWGTDAPSRGFSVTLPEGSRTKNFFTVHEPRILGYKGFFYSTKGKITEAPELYDSDLHLLDVTKPASVTLPANAAEATQAALKAAIAADSFADQAIHTAAEIGKEIDQLLEDPSPDIPLIKLKRSDVRQLLYSVAMAGSHAIPLVARASANLTLATRASTLSSTTKGGKKLPVPVREALLHAPIGGSKLFVGQCAEARKEADKLRLLMAPKPRPRQDTYTIPKKPAAANNAQAAQGGPNTRRGGGRRDFQPPFRNDEAPTDPPPKGGAKKEWVKKGAQDKSKGRGKKK